MKKRTGLFTGIKFLPAASLYLGENEASLSILTRKRFFSKKEVRQEFQAETLREMLEQAAAFLRTNPPPAKLTVVLNYSFFLERTVFLPFRSRKAVSMVLPGELAHLLPSSLSEYFYGFVVPVAEHLPVTVFLLPAAVHQSITEAFPDIPVLILPVGLVLSRHPAVTRSENALLLVSGKTQARLFLFQKGKYILGRSFNFGESDYRQRLAEENGLLLRSSRFPEMEPEPVIPDERLAFGLPSQPQDFTLKKGGQMSRPKDVSPLYIVVGGLVILWILFFASLRAKNAALLSYQQVSGKLAQQKEMAQVGGTSLASILSDKNVILLLQDEFSPLETFSRFNEALPNDLPLILDYLQVDRQKLILNGTLGDPTQVDTLVNQLTASGRFNEIVLGEVKIERGTVKFPLTAKITVAQK